MSNKILVTFTSEQNKIIKSLNGLMGNSKAEVVRTIVISWLSEKEYLTKMESGGKL